MAKRSISSVHQRKKQKIKKFALFLRIQFGVSIFIYENTNFGKRSTPCTCHTRFALEHAFMNKMNGFTSNSDCITS